MHYRHILIFNPICSFHPARSADRLSQANCTHSSLFLDPECFSCLFSSNAGLTSLPLAPFVLGEYCLLFSFPSPTNPPVVASSYLCFMRSGKQEACCTPKNCSVVHIALHDKSKMLVPVRNAAALCGFLAFGF